MDGAARLLTAILTIPGLDAAGLIHGFSTLALGSMQRSEPPSVTPERAEFAARLGLEPQHLTSAGAVHGTRVARVDAPALSVEGADGLATDRPRLPLLATFADCLPIVVYDPARRAVVLAHAGWRGTAGGIAGAAVAALRAEYESRPEDLVAGVGPGICGRCYEVGEEVAERFDPAVVGPSGRPGGFLLDLPDANRRQLLAAGVPAPRIHLCGICTLESPELPSHRRHPDGARFAGLVAIA